MNSLNRPPYKVFLFSMLFLFLLSSFIKFKNKSYTLVFVGDSITEGSALKDRIKEAPMVSCVDKLMTQKKIRIVGSLNMGHSGATTFDFLPGKKYYQQIIKSVNGLNEQQRAQLIFSIMLGTNDSAIEGPHGAPVSADRYSVNLGLIIDSLMQVFPKAVIIVNHPIWYSDNTYNGAKYLRQGQDRVIQYSSTIDKLVVNYNGLYPGHIFNGDKMGYDYFKVHFITDMKPEKGHMGTFYLHPNKEGSFALGEFWANAIYKILR